MAVTDTHVMVSGSRAWRSRAAILRAFTVWEEVTREAVGSSSPVVLVCGGARGADSLAADVAEQLGWGLCLHPADWNRYGKRAGIVRNLEMLAHDLAHVFIFWDGESRGTKHVIDEVQRRKQSYEIHLVAAATDRV